LWFPYLIFSLSSAPQTYALPGTNHVIISGESSLDTTQQIDMAVDATVAANSRPNSLEAYEASNSTADNHIWSQPYCFIADTDSVAYVLDTGANRVILNDAKLFTNFVARRGNVKGIGGDGVQALGHGSIKIPMKSDNGSVTYVTISDAVYVPTSPFNLPPPQMLINKVRHQGYGVDYSKHDDREYIFNYRKTPDSKACTLIVPIGANDLLTMQWNEGYTSFFRQAEEYDPEWRSFAGASHVIPDDDDNNSRHGETSDKQREPSHSPSLDKQRESNERVNAPTTTLNSPMRMPPVIPETIPFDETDFEPIKDKPIETEFNLDGREERYDDGNTAAYKRWQQRLMTIHERLGHISFARLKLLASAGHIPTELATVDSPTCPGCAYGKAHRHPKRTKGIKNLKKIRVATAPGQVVSVDQLVMQYAN
jgi:hypothetical protein